MENDQEVQARAARRALIIEVTTRIKAQNEAERDAKNARRWKTERDPAEYEAQKERQRREYQPRNGVAVRSYEKIEAATKLEHKAEAKARDAERKRGKYASLSTEERRDKSDRIADEAWMARRRAKGMTEEMLVAALAIRIRDRESKRAAQAGEDADEAAMRSLPTYSMV